jgi:hypothetical protein
MKFELIVAFKVLIKLRDTIKSKAYKLSNPHTHTNIYIYITSRYQWPRGLRRRSAAARLLRSWVRIPPTAWVFVCCECCVLSGRGLCEELITRPEKSYDCGASLRVI